MAKQIINQDKVFAACKRVVDRSLPLTARNVRDEIGGGSFTTLVPLLNEFKSKLQTETQARSQLPPPPSELQEFTKKMTQDLWVHLRMIVDKELKDLQLKHETQTNRLRKELEESREEVAGYSTEITNLEEVIKNLEQELINQRKKESETEGKLELLIKQNQQKETEIKSLLERAIKAEANSLKKQKDISQ